MNSFAVMIRSLHRSRASLAIRPLFVSSGTSFIIRIASFTARPCARSFFLRGTCLALLIQTHYHSVQFSSFTSLIQLHIVHSRYVCLCLHSLLIHNSFPFIIDSQFHIAVQTQSMDYFGTPHSSLLFVIL